MHISIRFFASLADELGIDALEWEVLDEPATTTAVWDSFIASRGRQAEKGAVRVAINQTYAGWDDVVQDGDEIAFFPPVTGG